MQERLYPFHSRLIVKDPMVKTDSLKCWLVGADHGQELAVPQHSARVVVYNRIEGCRTLQYARTWKPTAIPLRKLSAIEVITNRADDSGTQTIIYGTGGECFK